MKTLELENEIKAILSRAQDSMGSIPTFYGPMGDHVPELLIAYNELLSNTHGLIFNNLEVQYIMLVISELNCSSSCESFHREMVSFLSESDISDDQRARLEDLEDIVTTIYKSRGLLSQSDLEKIVDFGFQAKEVFGILHLISLKTISNIGSNLTASLEKWERGVH